MMNNIKFQMYFILFLVICHPSLADKIDSGNRDNLRIEYGPKLTKLGLCKLIAKDKNDDVLSFASIPIEGNCPKISSDKFVQTISVSDGASKRILNFIARLIEDSAYRERKLTEYKLKSGERINTFNTKGNRIAKESNKLVKIELVNKYKLKYGVTLLAARFYDKDNSIEWAMVINDSDSIDITGFFEIIED